ncbi:hypothetical protein JET18_10290 [Chryseobacterium sp. L7]|uniref:Lipoprotein n=1 Tax=Chryseobacterium endalhagicum TaxID=2797638 RepID=A0ABS1QF57_9FLAO|nr:hypothetical protein [Chryseobacterium endalhagicum]MBL1221230.1 hypothetical protein [Chryseobacterium endalhagicum]
MKKSITLLIGGILLTGCEEVSKSIKDTMEPKEDTIARHKTENIGEAPASVPYDAAVEQQIQEVQHLVTTMVEKHAQTRVQHTEGKNTDFLTNEEKLKKAEEALRRLPQYAGKNIYIYSTIHFYEDERIQVKLQHPTTPGYIDNYTYKNGSWSEPEPEQMSVKDNIQSRLMPLDHISFTHFAAAARLYTEKIAEVEGARPITSIYISIWNNNLRWFPATINGSRERYSIELNQNGTLKKFERE